MSDYNDRLKKIIGSDNIKKLENAKVLVVGLGGVGGSCFEALLRSFVGTIYVLDYDVFEKSNLNRQILSTVKDVGKYKTDVAIKRAKSINSKCKVIKINTMLSDENANDILPFDVDYVIDACDDVKAKIALIKFSFEYNIKIISSMGTGNKFKPELLQITSVWKTNYDPLAKKIRHALRKQNLCYDFPVVSSSEVITTDKKGPVGSFAPVPNTAGLLLASYVLNDIIGSK